MSYGKSNSPPDDFTSDEKVELALKTALGRIQSDLKRDWYKEPKDYVPKTPSELYRYNIPNYNDIKDYLIIDPGIDNTGTEMVTNITVNEVVNGAEFCNKKLTEIESGFTKTGVSDIACRSKASLTNSSLRTFVSGTSSTQIIGLGPNCFTRYNYHNGVNDSGTTRYLTGRYYNSSSSDSTEPYNALLTLKGDGTTNASTARVLELVNNARLGTNTSDSKYIFYNDLKDNAVSLDIIAPADKGDLTKRHPFLKVYLQVPTYPSETLSGSDNICFHNPVMEKSLGDDKGYFYRISGWNTSDAAWKTQTTAYSEKLFYFSNPGLIVIYGQNNVSTDSLFSSLYAPMVTFLRYTGGNFPETVINQGSALPSTANAASKDLFINTSDNTINRFDGSSWVGVGGSGGGGGGGGGGDTVINSDFSGITTILAGLTNDNSYYLGTQSYTAPLTTTPPPPHGFQISTMADFSAAGGASPGDVLYVYYNGTYITKFTTSLSSLVNFANDKGYSGAGPRIGPWGAAIYMYFGHISAVTSLNDENYTNWAGAGSQYIHDTRQSPTGDTYDGIGNFGWFDWTAAGITLYRVPQPPAIDVGSIGYLKNTAAKSQIKFQKSTDDKGVIVFTSGNDDDAMDIDVDGTVTVNGSFTNSSDDRIKHNEKSIINALDTIKLLNPVKYLKNINGGFYPAGHNFLLDQSNNPIDESGNIIDIKLITESGFIAQSVEKIEELNHLVKNNSSKRNRPYSLSYNGIIPYNTKAIKELDSICQLEKTKLESAETKIAALEAENLQLKTRLDAIEAKLTAAGI